MIFLNGGLLHKIYFPLQNFISKLFYKKLHFSSYALEYDVSSNFI